jgi:H+-transporting ATPase
VALTGDEARRRLEQFGPNAMPDTSVHPWRRALTKLWAPVPWMLEAAIVLDIVLGKYLGIDRKIPPVTLHAHR